MYRGEFEVGSTKFTLDIEDTSGTFAWDFPAMVEVSNVSVKPSPLLRTPSKTSYL